MSYALYVGKSLNGAGHAWLAGYGDEPSGHWLQITPSREHPPGATISVGVTADAALPGRLSEIPQAAQTARYMGVNYSDYLGAPAPLTNGGVNQYGVAVRDVWSPSRPIGEVRQGEPGAEYPHFIAGARRAPPEDVGGISGFEEFLKAILDSDYEEHERTVEWYKGSFDTDDIDERMIRLIIWSFAVRRRGPLKSHRGGGRRTSS